MSIDGQGTKWRRNIAENINRLSRAHERYRQTTDGRTTTYSEHELEFMFANYLSKLSTGENYSFFTSNTQVYVISDDAEGRASEVI